MKLSFLSTKEGARGQPFGSKMNCCYQVFGDQQRNISGTIHLRRAASSCRKDRCRYLLGRLDVYSGDDGSIIYVRGRFSPTCRSITGIRFEILTVLW